MASSLIHRGLNFTIAHPRDDDHGAPWEDDGRGVVTDWLYYPDDPNLRKLGSEQRDGTARYFDTAATLIKATAEGWGLAPDAEAALIVQLGRMPEPAERIAAAVEAEYQFLDGWASDDWEYVGVVVTLAGSEISRSLWGIESTATEYLAEVARDLADEILTNVGTELEAEIALLNQLRATIGAATRIEVRR